MNKQIQNLKYVLLDVFSSALAWTLFYIFRRYYVEPLKYGYDVNVLYFDRNYFMAMAFIPIFWVAIFWMFGSYYNVYRKSRIKELSQTITLTFLGSIVLFFTLLTDDVVSSTRIFGITFLTLFLLMFVCIFLFRILFLNNIKHKLTRRKIGFNTLLVGGNSRAFTLYSETEKSKYSEGYRFVGYVNMESEADSNLNFPLPRLGNYEDLPALIKSYKIEEVIIAVETSEHHRINRIISLLEDEAIVIKVIPDMYDIITGSVKMNYLFGTALIEIMPEIMPIWQIHTKRLIDIFCSLFYLIILSPLYLILAIWVKLDSKGPIFFSQERIGLHGKPFFIHKFRTMYVDAEKLGPALSSKDDPRITRSGKWLRRFRLDELPQFWNVLVGTMSIVGPRPERQYFIDRIVEIAPHYKHLTKVKPGITSWGQIKYGYAENIEQMVERMKFDILYIENMSLAMDIKIFFYTIKIVVQGRGK